MILLFINMQKGWFTTQAPEGYSLFNEIYTFDYFFKSNQYGSGIRLTNSTTSFLLRSEIVFLISIVAMIFALILAHVKMNKGNETISRLPILNPSVKTMQWLSDFLYTLCIWLAHLVGIFVFYIIYTRLAPAELRYSQSLYQLFAGERYLYMLFPVLNPLSWIRMFSLMLAISFLPSLISKVIEDFEENDFSDDSSGIRLLSIAPLIGFIGWGYFASSHLWSIIACMAAAVIGFLIFRGELRKGRVIDAEESV